MYDITKTRMLVTTAVFAAVAAVFVGGASARILPGEVGSGFEGQLSFVGVVGAPAPSWRGKGGKGEETGSVTNPLQQTGVTRSGPAADLTRPCSPQESRASC